MPTGVEEAVAAKDARGSSKPIKKEEGLAVKKEATPAVAAAAATTVGMKPIKSEDNTAVAIGANTPIAATNTQVSGTAPQPIQPQASKTPKEPDQYENYPLKNIRTPHAHDVLCGRGGGTNNHAGNESFRDLVNERKRVYLNSSKREKPLVSRSIVEAVRARRPPGRFLTKDEKTGLWNDIGDQKAREKTSQALREGAPVIRREIGMNAAAAAASAANRTLAPQPPPGPPNRMNGGTATASSPHRHLNVAGGASWGSSPHHSLQSSKTGAVDVVAAQQHAHHHVAHHPHAHLLPHHPPPNGVVGAPASSPLNVPPRPSPLKNGSRAISDVTSMHSSRPPAMGAGALAVSELSTLQPPPSASPHALSSPAATGMAGAADASPMSSAVPESVRHLLRRADQNNGQQQQQQLSAQMQVQLERQRAAAAQQQIDVEVQRAQQLQHQGYAQSQLMASTQMPYQHHQTVPMSSQYGGLPLHHALSGSGAGSVITAAAPPLSTLRETSAPGTDGLRRHAPPLQQHLQQQQQYLGGGGGASGRGAAAPTPAQSSHPPYNVGSHGATPATHEAPSWTNSATLPSKTAAAPLINKEQPKLKVSQPPQTQPLASSAATKVEPTNQKHLSSLPEEIQDKIRLLESEAKSIAGKTAKISDWALVNLKSGIYMDAGLLGVDLDDIEAALQKNGGNGGLLSSSEMEKALKHCCRTGKGGKDSTKFKQIHTEKNETDRSKTKKRKLNGDMSESNDGKKFKPCDKAEDTKTAQKNTTETSEKVSENVNGESKKDGKDSSSPSQNPTPEKKIAEDSSASETKAKSENGEKTIEELGLFGNRRKATDTCKQIVSVLRTIDAACS